MKNYSFINLFVVMVFSLLLGACDYDDDYVSYSIDLKDTPDQYEYLDENGELEIPLYVASEAGIKSAYYKVGVKNDEGKVVIGNAVDIPVPEKSSNDILSVKIPVVKNMSHIFFAVFDKNDQLYKRTVTVAEVRNAPVLAFKDNVDQKKTVCVGIPFNIKGEIQSEYELASVWAVPVVNGVEKEAVQGSLSSTNFELSIPVEAGLQSVLVKAANVHGGVATKEFKVLNVVMEDFLDLTFTSDLTELNRTIIGKVKSIDGIIASGSDIVSVKYAIKKNGSLGNYTELPLIDSEGNEAKFSIQLTGEEGMESVEIVAANQGNVTTTEKPRVKVLSASRVASLTDVTMSTDPADNACFLALFEETPVFGVSTAINKQERIDFYLANKGNGVQPLSPHAYGAGDAYYNASKPYITGFETLTYAFISAKRGKITKDAFDAISSEQGLQEFLESSIIPPSPDGENYKIYTASRRVGDTFNDTSKKEGGFLFGWGTHSHPTVSPAVGVSNVAFAIFYVKSVTKKANGHWTMVFDVKYPLTDERAANTGGSIAPYAPFPL
ncbi:hypothetical protein FNW54_06395 [Bacteroides sp. HF-5092]|uniref:hypothetical protein n=1 Tax=Bacteroides TaxID=816 RepID=UPI0011778BEF|nr:MULTISPECIES: hypothetical protein [Bacteroides]TRX45973.1 hypothetical protein FNW54_06395 [Bacteroides sp. HF-5092]